MKVVAVFATLCVLTSGWLTLPMSPSHRVSPLRAAAPLEPAAYEEIPEETRRARQFIEEKALQYEEFLPVTCEHLSASSKKRLVQLLGSDLTWSPGDADEKPEFATTFEEAFEKFCESCPEWKNLDNVFWKEDAGYLVMRCQRSGLCYMHAVVVFVHYLVALSTGREDHEMIDIGAYMRDCFSSIALRDQICSNRGGRSIGLLRSMGGLKRRELRSITIPRKSKSEESFKYMVDVVVENFEKDGRPALVSGFRVEGAFKDASILSHSGTVPESAAEDIHAMLLIGARKTEDGTVYFLLQNWWSSKFFVEVTAEYLASAEATVTFVTKEKIVLPRKFKMVDAYFAQTDDTPLESDETALRELVPPGLFSQHSSWLIFHINKIIILVKISISRNSVRDGWPKLLLR